MPRTSVWKRVGEGVSSEAVRRSWVVANEPNAVLTGRAFDLRSYPILNTHAGILSHRMACRD